LSSGMSRRSRWQWPHYSSARLRHESGRCLLCGSRGLYQVVSGCTSLRPDMTRAYLQSLGGRSFRPGFYVMGNLSPRPPSSQRLPPILLRVPLCSYVVLGHPIMPTEEELRRVHSTRREARKVRKRDVSFVLLS
jgi:hypothetical protein